MKKSIFLLLFILIFLFGCEKYNQTNDISHDSNNKQQEETIKDYDNTLGIGININNFPDSEFIKYIKDNIDIDKNNYLSNEEIEKTKTITLSNNINLHSLDGLNHFTKLNEIIIDTVSLTNIDISRLCDLQTIHISRVPIKTLDISNNQKLERLDIVDTNIDYIDLNNSNAVFEVNISDLNNNLTLDITNCKYLKDNMYYLFDNVRNHMFEEYSIYDGFIDVDNFNGNYVNIICNDRIIIHYFDFDRQISSNGYVSGYDKYTFGQGSYNTENKIFSTYDEAYDYGFYGNKWFNIVQHYYIKGEACEISECVSIKESCTFQYEVIVYDKQPF